MINTGGLWLSLPRVGHDGTPGVHQVSGDGHDVPISPETAARREYPSTNTVRNSPASGEGEFSPTPNQAPQSSSSGAVPGLYLSPPCPGG